MARTSKGVYFTLKNPKANISPIKAIFCYAKTQMYYYERKLSIPSKFWNKVARRAKETKAFPDYAELNSTLDHIESAILDCYRRFKNENNTEPSVEQLREMVKERRNGKATINKQLEFIEFIDTFINEAKEGKHLNLATAKPVAKTTINTYEQTFNLLKEFAKSKHIKMSFETIDIMFYKQFVHFMLKEFLSTDTEEHLKINTAGKHITNLKTFMNVAAERKLTVNEDFKRFKVLREDVDKISLSDDEIKMLEDYDLSNNKRLECARDMFVIGCYTALRISDLKRVTDQHIIINNDGWFIEIEMQKTGKKVTIPVSERLKIILQKYKTTTGKYMPRGISPQKTNEYIKEVAAKIDAFKTEVIINSTLEGKRVSNSIPKYELISNHTGRRSFATNAALKGISYQAIMPITGHKTEKSFLRYIKIDGVDAAKLYMTQMNIISSN
ncbi:MAG: site-specific integrase [Bacteroidetes bacterium]|nr:site-specific integrase [Bacteroidota bacterium]